MTMNSTITRARSGAANAYRSEAVNAAEFADPHKLVAMLLDGAVERLSQARGAIERGLTAHKGERIGKAISIIEGLRATLDMEQGGDIASNLGALYQYMQQRLLTANLHNDTAAIDEVLRLLREIKSGWDGIAAVQSANGT